MPDRFADYAMSLEAPAETGFAITPSNGTDLPEVTRAVYVGTSGDLATILSSGAELVFTGVQGGTVLPVRVRRIRATGTTAAAIVGLA